MTSATDRAARALAHFDQLVDLDAADRAARLDSLRSQDAALADEVVRMLAADAGPGGMFDRGLHALTAGQASASEGTTGTEGRRVGPFTLRGLLGRGGMGEVWLAQRVEGDFRQDVALKLLRRGMDSEDVLRRFVQERRILAELSHPGIARFIDGGVGESGAPWYAMEYVEGVALTEYARDHGLGVRERVSLMADVAEAVAYAQTRLVVHRDLKPSNILVDAAGRVHLLDFGIAKLMQVEVDGRATATGIRAMSPSYAAPEQILDEAISTATDVYALGVVLYELLTASLPHQRAGTTLETLAEQVRNEAPDRPSARLRQADASATMTLGTGAGTLLRFARVVAGELDTIVLTALRREPARRYASAAALAEDLRRWLGGRPVAAQPDTARYRMRKYVSRHRLAVGSAGAVLLALVAGFGTALWQADVAREQAVRAIAAQQQSDQINRFFGQRLNDGQATEQGAGVALTMKDWVIAAIPKLDLELADAPRARALLRRELGASILRLGGLAQSIEVLQQAVVESRAVFGDGLETASALYYYGMALNQLGDLARARANVEESLAMLDRLPPTDEVRQARIYSLTTMLRIVNAGGDYATALQIAHRNIAERGALYGADDTRLAVDYNNLSATLGRMGRVREAELAIRKAIELLAKNPAHPVARMAYLQTGLCGLALQRADYAAALAACARGRTLITQALGAEHPDALWVMVAQARALYSAGELAQARDQLAQVLPRLTQLQQAPELREALLLAMHIAAVDNDWAHVQGAGAQFLPLAPRVSGSESSPERAIAEIYLALAVYQQGPTPAALEALGVASRSLLERDDVPNYLRANAAACWSVGMEHAGQRQRAAEIRQRGLAILQQDMSAELARGLWQRWLPLSAPD